MRPTIVILLIILISFSCNSPAEKTPAIPTADSTTYNYPYDTLKGAYIGDFGGSDIRLILAHVTGVHAVGYDLHKGLRRNISGTMHQAGNTFTFLLNEPGDNPYDGKFDFTIDTATFVLTGTWTPLNNKTLTQKTFTLKKLIDTGVNEYVTFTRYTDSIGDFTFSKNGICVYEFYPVINGVSAEQLIRVKGTWSLKDSVYTVDWEQNTIFPSRRSVFIHRMLKEDTVDYTFMPERIIGEGRTLFTNEF